MIWVSAEYFHFMGSYTFTNFGNSMPWVLINSKSARQRSLWEISVLSFTFPVLCKFTFPIFLELYGFMLHSKQLRNPLLWNVCFSPYFSRIMEIHFSQVLAIVWISASSKIFKKPTNLKCLCFSIHFPYNGNPRFPRIGYCMDFCIKRKILETLNFEMFLFSHIFPLLWEFTFPMFWQLHGFLLHPKYLRNFEMFVFFPCFSRIMRIHFSHVLGIVWISASSKIFRKPINLKCLCFPLLFRIMEIHFSHMLGSAQISASSKKIPETLNFEMFMFSHIFSLLCEFTYFLIFWELYVLMPHIKYVRSPQLQNACVFSYFSRPMTFQLFPTFLELYWFLFHAKQNSAEYIRNQNLWNICVFP